MVNKRPTCSCPHIIEGSHVVVTKNIIPEAEARELFRMFVSIHTWLRFLLADYLSHSFYHGCSTFLPIFDVNIDTFDALHERSPFAVDCVCMVAAQVRDGGGKNNSCANVGHG